MRHYKTHPNKAMRREMERLGIDDTFLEQRFAGKLTRGKQVDDGCLSILNLSICPLLDTDFDSDDNGREYLREV